MSNDFVHLHVHTDFSILDGACRINDLAELANEFQMPAVACTDHGNMSASIEFYQAFKKAGLKPIVGCECYVATGGRRERDPNVPHVQGFHLVLLAQNFEGYQNLCSLNAAAHLEGYYYKPRIDRELLSQYNGGLIALTACIGGEIPARLLEENPAAAKEALRFYLDCFGKDRFYVELQDHGMREEKRVNPRLIKMADEHGIGIVATNDAHYLRKEHADAHDVLLCIGTQSKVTDEKRMRFPAAEFYFKSPQEMAALFAERPDALSNTIAIAEQCNLELKVGDSAENHYPVYEVPSEYPDREDYLRMICVQGLQDRYGISLENGELSDDDRAVVERMDYELGVIQQLGFVSYFLVVWDFIRFAHEQGIPVGPGRGSGAGSLVAYLTHITDIDPLRYALLFERFLNPDRVSPPDFDIDLCERRRQEVIAYVRTKYGEDSVAQIGTFGTLKAKAVLKDVARALGQPFAEGNNLTKLIPADPKMTLAKALDESQDLRQRQADEEWVRDAIRYSEVLEGLNRNQSIHAAGVIIGDQPLSQLVPLARGAGNEVITQYPAGPCEKLGLLKMDFLGLRTLTIIQDALDLIRQNKGVALTSSDIPLGDQATFDLLNKGNTIGVFQLESGGMRDLCRRFGIQRLEDIIALIALYRPGPMQFLDDFINRKTGQATFDYDVPAMRPILEETYGIMLYQEQVMQVVQKVAGFSLGHADILRRAMGKKDIAVMEQQYSRFTKGCAENAISEPVAKAIWEKIAKFAGYGFNKSHSAAYAMLSYRTAYLKANYPVEFMAAVLSSELGNSDKLAFFLRECREMGIEIRPPDVNTSGLNFTVDGSNVCFGLSPVKGVGSAAAREIINARQDGPFVGLMDFCERTGQHVNRRVMENLCKAGAFDRFGLKRSQVFALIDEALERAQQTKRDRAVGQGSLFDMLDAVEENPLQLVAPDIPEWDSRELLGYEKELLGFYVTGHPLNEFAEVVRTFELHSVGELVQAEAEVVTRTAGIVTGVTLKRSKRDNRQWAIIELEGFDGTLEGLVFSDTFEAYEELLGTEAAVFVEGAMSNRDEDSYSLIVNRIIPIESAPEVLTREVHIRLQQEKAGNEVLQQLKQICEQYRGETSVILCLMCEGGEIAFLRPDDLAVLNSSEFQDAIRELCGEEALWQKPNREPEVQQRKQWRRSGRPRETEAVTA